MARSLSTGHTSLVLIAGQVHVHHARRFVAKARRTLCGALLTGQEPRGALETEDAAALNAFNVCHACALEFMDRGHLKVALTSSVPLAPPVLAGQLPLFDC